ncbi:MAG: CHAT domain-containing tetratricopeptide repeat protein [Thermoanaerobaculia bacterium]
MKPRHQLALALTALLGLAPALAQPPDAQARVAALEAQAESDQYAGRLAQAEEGFRAALEAGEAAWGESLPVAATLARLGNVVRLQSRLDEAQQIQERALAIRERLAPDGVEVADSLHHLAMLAVDSGDTEALAGHIRRALAILEHGLRDSLEMANIQSDLALEAMDCGRYAEAAAALQRAQEILERRAPGSIQMATNLGRLGLMLRLLGDPDAAVEALQRALAIREKLAPGSVGTAVALTNLGMVARDRGDLDAARGYLERALAISEKASPNGIGVAGSLNALGVIARLRGDLDEAWRLHQRARELSRRLPSRTDEARILNGLGLVAEARGDLSAALDLYQQALALFEQWGPASIEKPETLRQIGTLHRRAGRPDQAGLFLARAVDELEAQTERVGGSQELQSTFRAGHEAIYRDAIELELERGNAAAAFHLVERSRARSFLRLLAERELGFGGDLPAGLERARRDNAARYDRALRDLAATPADAAPRREALQSELLRLRQERDRIAAEIREASPRLAELRQPRPLDLDAARAALDPGTLALSYSVGKDRTDLFALTREGGLQWKTLPVGEEKLRREVEVFLERVRSQQKPAASLYRELIGPVADLVERSERVLILPDGPLHRLPFGALAGDDGRFLIERKPVHTALSLTVYGTLRASAMPPVSAGLVAFGDPRFPKDMQAKSDLSPGLRRFDWSSLPYSRREVEQIASIYPGASVYLGEEATEERARSIRGARILHFATHGYTDDRSPLDSALVLTIPEKLAPGRGITRENGLLQVWEIFESVRIDADLVVLSACESALGRELSGEGLIGLTRAFQYAGARSVVASLWSVADQVTAELMARFHRHLAAGLPKDQALRAAQIELIREPVQLATASGQTIETEASAPFFWAAFELFGDWR